MLLVEGNSDRIAVQIQMTCPILQVVYHDYVPVKVVRWFYSRSRKGA